MALPGHAAPAGITAGPSSLASTAGPPQGQPESIYAGTHVPVLDGIRGLAIVLVVSYHSIRFGGMHPIIAVDRIVQQLGMVGWSGVDLFFVLSGFLITGILYDAKSGLGYFRNFYARRILRIFPLYYGFLLCAFVVLPSLAARGGAHSPLASEQIWYWTYLQNVWIALRGWPVVATIEHFWSLAVEEQFYLVWPLVVLLLSRRALMLACLGIAAGSLGVRVVFVILGHELAAYVLMPSRMDALALGGLLALVARTPGAMPRLARWARPVVTISALCLGAIFLWRHGLHFWDKVVETIGFSLLAILFGGVLVIAVASPPSALVRKLFAHRVLRMLGRYSYAMYVFHLPIIISIAHFFSVGSIPRLARSQLPGQFVFTSVVATVSLAAASLSWRLYETPFLKLKTLFPYGMKAAPAQAGASESQPRHAA